MKEFPQIEWDEAIEDDCRQIVRLAIREDLDRHFDWTTVSLVPSDVRGAAVIGVRQAGVIAGLRAIPTVLDEMECSVEFESLAQDGSHVQPGASLGRIAGSVRDLLVAERLILNLLGKLSGIATLAAQYAAEVAHTKAKVYDTRKTTPGFRRLEKYAARCGGASNHRMGLYAAVLIKDNHLAFGASGTKADRFAPGEAVNRAQVFLEKTLPAEQASEMIVEIEVDSLAQLRNALPAFPDIVLLDNMNPDLLREAVKIRDELAPQVQLEASGGVNLATIRTVAESGVNRISVGAITHSAVNLDVGLDWADA